MYGSSALRTTFLVVMVLMLLVPSFAFAQIPTIVPCKGADCSFCDIGKLAQNILNGGIYIAVFLSAFLFAWAGWTYITAGGESGKAEEAKKIFWNVGIGLVMILAAWLVIDFIMKMLTNESALFGPWNKIC